MPTLAIRTTPTLQSAVLRVFALLAVATLLPVPEANAFAPQDSSYPSRTVPKLSGESWNAVMVANDRIWYSATNNQGPIRARNLAGELVFECVDTRFRPSHGLATSTDGRLYYFYQSTGEYLRRIAIIAPDGTRLGDFGPAGRGSGDFGSGSGLTICRAAVSPKTGRIYVSDHNLNNGGSGVDPTKKGSVRVFDREGNFLHEFRITGILATTVEGYTSKIIVREDAQGLDEAIFIEILPSSSACNFKVFGGDGSFRRLVTGGFFTANQDNWAVLSSAVLWEDRLIFTTSASSFITPAGIISGDEILAQFPNGLSSVLGVHKSVGFIGHTGPNGTDNLVFRPYPNFSNFDAGSRNAVPNPWVLKVAQRPGTGIVDIDYRVDDLNDATVTTALLPLATGVASLANVLPFSTVLEGTGARVGANQPSNQVQRVTWNAGADWNVDFGTLRVMALARDSRTRWFDVHLVEIPADGTRPAVAISRIPLREEDFLAQFLWLVAIKDPSVRLEGGVLFGTTGTDNGVILANGTTSTAAGRDFLLKRDGLRVATAAEVTRAREGATPGFVVQLTPPLQMLRSAPSGSFPSAINEFGVESGSVGTSAWYVVRIQAN